MDLTVPITYDWLAGYLEGEGSFIIQPNGQGIVVCATSTDLDVLKAIQDKYGGNLYKLKKREEHWKDCWRWQLRGKEAYSLCKIIKHLLFSRRREKCLTLIENYQNSYTVKKQKELKLRAEKIKELKQEGLTHKAIAEKLNIHRTTVSHFLRKLSGK